MVHLWFDGAITRETTSSPSLPWQQMLRAHRAGAGRTWRRSRPNGNYSFRAVCVCVWRVEGTEDDDDGVGAGYVNRSARQLTVLDSLFAQQEVGLFSLSHVARHALLTHARTLTSCFGLQAALHV